MHTSARAHTHTRTHARTCTHARARAHTHTHAHARAHAHTHTHAHAHTHTHTHTHTHFQWTRLPFCCRRAHDKVQRGEEPGQGEPGQALWWDLLAAVQLRWLQSLCWLQRGRNQGKDLAHDAPSVCKARAQGLYVSPDLSNVMLNVPERRTVTARTDSQVVRLEWGWE